MSDPLVIDVDGREIEVSNPDKVLFPEAGVTKAGLARYHERMAERMLPYLADRPVALLRAPDGIDAHRFFQKERPQHFPDWMETATLTRRGGGEVTHVVVADAPTLVYLADQACVEIHTLLSRADRPERPDVVIFDLDPSTDDLEPVRVAAGLLRDLLAELDLPAWVKSSGSRGLHVHVPIRRDVDFDEARRVAVAIAERVEAEEPEMLTTEVRKAERGDRLFLDVGRNGYGQHAVVPYGVRARGPAPVAVPLDWDEAVAPGFDPQRFTVANVFRRLAHKADPWADYGRVATRLGGVLAQLGG